MRWANRLSTAAITLRALKLVGDYDAQCCEERKEAHAPLLLLLLHLVAQVEDELPVLAGEVLIGGLRWRGVRLLLECRRVGSGVLTDDLVVGVGLAASEHGIRVCVNRRCVSERRGEEMEGGEEGCDGYCGIAAQDGCAGRARDWDERLEAMSLTARALPDACSIWVSEAPLGPPARRLTAASPEQPHTPSCSRPPWPRVCLPFLSVPACPI